MNRSNIKSNIPTGNYLILTATNRNDANIYVCSPRGRNYSTFDTNRINAADIYAESKLIGITSLLNGQTKVASGVDYINKLRNFE